ncbi:protein lifeguard 1-like [Drosophila guanche]|uniref:protein lifeguard 1-like n=1 Tax=Drosophila guanche TaxID=7266 RepID=UPI0014725E2D|nr:protein lifeguard 1-like [Drosophila guanche]
MRHLPSQVLMAFGCKGLLVAALALFDSFAPYDFPACGPYLLVLFLVMLIMGSAMIFYRTHLMFCLYCSLGILVYSLYLLVDIQHFMGHHKVLHQLGEHILNYIMKNEQATMGNVDPILIIGVGIAFY